MAVDEGSDQNLDLKPCWIGQHRYLNGAFHIWYKYQNHVWKITFLSGYFEVITAIIVLHGVA